MPFHETRAFQAVDDPDHRRFARREFVREFGDGEFLAVGKRLDEGYLGEGKSHFGEFSGYGGVEARVYFPDEEGGFETEFGPAELGRLFGYRIHTNNMHCNDNPVKGSRGNMLCVPDDAGYLRIVAAGRLRGP